MPSSCLVAVFVTVPAWLLSSCCLAVFVLHLDTINRKNRHHMYLLHRVFFATRKNVPGTFFVTTRKKIRPLKPKQ